MFLYCFDESIFKVSVQNFIKKCNVIMRTTTIHGQMDTNSLQCVHFSFA